LTEKGVDFESINYTQKPFSFDELKRLLRQAGLSPKEVLRTSEDAYRQHVAGKTLSEEQLIRIMTEHPEIIQRPIVVAGDKAVLARPVERLDELGIK